MYNPNINARDIFVIRMQPLKILRDIFTVMNAMVCLAIHEKSIGQILMQKDILIDIS